MHRAFQPERQVLAAERGRIHPMLDLIMRHLLQDRAAAPVLRRQALEMVAQVRLDLPLGLGDESQAGSIAQDPCHRADEERTRIPEGIQ